MPTPSLSVPATLAARAVSQQFDTRPSLVSVIVQVLGAALAERYPTLVIDLPNTRLASPVGNVKWEFSRFTTVIQQYLASGTPLDFTEGATLGYYLSDAPPKRLKLPGLTRQKLDMTVVEGLIKDLRTTLPIALQDALASYWNEACDNAVSRWRWLADMLLNTLRASALRDTALNAADRQTLEQVIRTPDRQQRLAQHGEDAVLAYGVETLLSDEGRTERLLTEHILLTRPINGAAPVLLCTAGGRVEHFASMDAFTQTWGERQGAQYQAQTITCNRYEPEGSIFEHQASVILDQQLMQLGALNFPLDLGLQTLDTLYLEITDPGLYFLDALEAPEPTLAPLRPHVPAPLSAASPANRAGYRHYSLALASAKKRASDTGPVSEIDGIHTYTVKALQRELKRQTSDNAADEWNPDDLLLDFVVAAGYPGGAGIVEHAKMSLTEFAIKNLSGRPSGQFSIRHRKHTALPGWMTPDYITQLIERVDIGKNYPLLLKQALLSNTPQARLQEARFSNQLSAHLPLLALELSLKAEAGVTPKGADMVAALMQADSTDQRVDNRAVVIRHLTLLRAPNARPDTVSNMYIIEFQDIHNGPHLLYRPLYAQSLLEFDSRAALMTAIATAGELQASVLTWLADLARPIYDNGGFLEPHYLRFGQGDEFAVRQTPPPATLSLDGINDELQQCLVTGRLLPYLFSDHARALVDQAERESVSNHESRWAILLEGSSLLFSSLVLPLLRGPLMLTAWLLNMVTSLSVDIQALGSTDAVTREQGAIDLLLNVAQLLLDSPALTRSRPLGDSTLKQYGRRRSTPPRSPEQWPVLAPTRILQGKVSLAGELPGGNVTALDFSFAQAHLRLNPRQRMRLAAYKVPKPATLPAPAPEGPRKGLYLIGTTWHALINDDLYPVSLQADGGVVVVDPANPERHGPYLRTTSQGGWSVDTRLRLHGGMPLGRIAAERQRKAQRKLQLQTDYQQFVSQQAQVQHTVDMAERDMSRAEQDTRISQEHRTQRRNDYDTTLQTQTDGYRLILDSLKERDELAIALPPATVAALLENAINNARKHVLMAEKNRQTLYSSHQRFVGEGNALYLAVISEPSSYRQFIDQTMHINERTLHWLELKDRYLGQLFDLGTPGAGGFARLTHNRPNELSALAVKDLQIRTLKRMLVKDFQHPLFDALDTIMKPLQQQVRTHAELNALELAASDRLNVLTSLVNHYGSALDALQGLNIVDSDVLEPARFSQLFKLIEGLYQDASVQLAAEIKPGPQPRKRPPRRPVTVAGRPPKRVIKTRKGTLIGELRPVGNVEVVEVRAEGSDQVLGSYAQSGEEWVEFVERRPQPPLPAARSLNLVKGEGRTLLGMLDDHLRRGEQYKKISRHPQEVEEVLEYEAVRYDRLATELDRAIEAQPEHARLAADRTLANDLRQASVRLSSQGRALRLQLCLELPPTHGNLEYLIEQKQANIARLGKRIQLSGAKRDFIQEYAINDPGGRPLWYAHFHYPAADTPNTEYSAAHLKTREQRRQNYFTLLDRAQSPQAVVDVHRGLIGKALAQRWFLSLDA